VPDADRGDRGEPVSETSRECRIEFDREDLRRPTGEGFGEDPGARAELDDPVAVADLGVRDQLAGEPVASEVVLRETGSIEPCPSVPPGHGRPFPSKSSSTW